MPCKIVNVIYCIISSFVANVVLGVCALKRTQTQTHSHLCSTATLKMSTSTTTATAKSKYKKKNKSRIVFQAVLMFGGALHSFINVMFFYIVHLFLWFLFCVFLLGYLCYVCIFRRAHSGTRLLSITDCLSWNFYFICTHI